MKITEETVDIMKAYLLTLEELAYLWSIFFKENWTIELSQVSINKLIRMNILLRRGKLTKIGEEIVIELMDFPPEPDSTLAESNMEAFEKFWKLYPRDDANGIHPRTRQLRWNKSLTREEFLKLCEEYDASTILITLQRELDYRKLPSKTNMLATMCNSVNWFKKKAYETFLDDEGEEEIPDEYGKRIV